MPLRTENIFSPIQHERVSEGIERQIKEAIIKRHYLAGDKLPPERELARIFGASRSSTREAIRSLKRSGFVVIRKGVQGGAFVVGKGDPKPMVNYLRDMLRFRGVTLEEVLQARIALEPRIASEVAEKATTEDIERLEEITRDFDKGFDPTNPVMQYDRNPRFHNVIAQMTGNHVFIIIMEILMEIHSFRMSKFKLDIKTKQKIVREHEGIIEALKKKDKDMAFEQMKRHVLHVHEMHRKLEKERSKMKETSVRIEK